MKKLLFKITCTVLLLLYGSVSHAATYYFTGTAGGLANTPGNWSTAKTGGTALTGSNMNSYFSASVTAHKFDLNGKNVNFGGSQLDGCEILNSGASCSLTVANNSTLIINNLPNFNFSAGTATGNVNVNFRVGTTSTVKYALGTTGSSQNIMPYDYAVLDIAGTTSAIRTIHSSNTINVWNKLNFSGGALNIEGTLSLKQTTTSISGSSGSMTLATTGVISDSRTSKLFPVNFYNLKSTIPTGSYNNLFLEAATALSGDITILNLLKIGTDLYDYTLDLSGKTLTMVGYLECTSGYLASSGSSTTNSRIIAETGTIVISTSSALASSNGPFIFNPNNYGKTIASGVTGTDLADTGYIANLIIDSDVDPQFNVDDYAMYPYIYSQKIKDCTIKKGKMSIDECVVKITGNLTVQNGVATPAELIALNSTGNPSHLNLKNSAAKLVINNTTATLSTFTIDPTLYNESTIAGLYVNFTSGGNAVLGGDLIVNNSLDLTSTTGNYLKINDYTLTTNGTISSSSTGTKLVGSNKSNLVSGATGTVYFDQTSNSNRTLKDLTVNNDKKLTLGNWLYITAGTIDATTGAPNYDYGKVKVENSTSATSELATGDYLILEATAAGFAQVDVTDGDITGNMHVQTYFDGTHGRRYRFLAPQVTNGNVYSLRDSGSVVGASTGIKELVNNWGIQITGKLGTNSTDDTSFDVSTTKNPSAFEFVEANAGSTGLGTGNDAGWKPLHSGKQTLANGKGYRILVRGDRTIELTGTSGNAADQIETTTQITGDYVGTSKTITLYNSGNTSAANNGVNFIGNPYPATIDWDVVYSNNSSSGVDPTYVIYDNTSGSYSHYNALSSTGNSCGNLISSGQGFLVYTTTNNASLVIDESCKDVSGLGERFFKKIRTNHLAIKMEKDANNFDRTILYFLPGSTTTYDKYDAGHIKNSSVNLASVDDQNNFYSINCLDTLGATKSVPLTFDGTAVGTYTVSFEDCGTFQNHDIFLVDNFKKTTTKMDDVTKYSFSITSDPFSAQNGRLTVMFAPKEASATNKIVKGQGIIISPNPINDKINLNIKEGVSYEFEITNIEGKVIKYGKLDRNSKSINAISLTNGIYFITLNSNNETQTIKFIK